MIPQKVIFEWGKTNEFHECGYISLVWSRERPRGLRVDQLQAEATKKAYCDAEMGKASDKKAWSLWKNGWKWIGTQAKCIEINVIERLESNFASIRKDFSNSFNRLQIRPGRETIFWKTRFRWFPLLLSILYQASKESDLDTVSGAPSRWVCCEFERFQHVLVDFQRLSTTTVYI